MFKTCTLNAGEADAVQKSGTQEVHVGLKAVRGRSTPRGGTVLGAGGVLGAARGMTGALPALQERLPCPLGEVDLIVGTSAGSVIRRRAALRDQHRRDDRHQRGEAVGPLGTPPRISSPGAPASGAAAAARIGPGRCWPCRRPRTGCTRTAGRQRLAAAGPGQSRCAPGYGARPAHPPSACRCGGATIRLGRRRDLDRGRGLRLRRRAVFGLPGPAPPARLADAVVASCSIPGWFEPAVDGGRR